VKLRATRIEDVPIVELSSLALVADEAGQLQLLAIGDKHSRLARATLTDDPLDWTVVELGRGGGGDTQFEGIAAGGDGTVLVLTEDPPRVTVLGPDGGPAERIKLVAGDRGVERDVFEESASAGEGLLLLTGGRLLIAKEKDPPLLVEFGPPGTAAIGVSGTSFPAPGEPLDALGVHLQALAAWRLDDVEDVSDLAHRRGSLYCLSDQSRRVVVVDLPLDPDGGRARIGDGWDLRVPERRGEPDGKPEGLVVLEDGTFVVGLDTKSPRDNLCWYRP
jgi:uncharacterized protein YjiK